MSSINNDSDAPEVNSNTSKGSSVSSGLQEEYNDLLKYALVTPKWDPPVSADSDALPQLELKEPGDNMPLSIVDQLSATLESLSQPSNRAENVSVSDGRDSAMGSEELLSGRKTDRAADRSYKPITPLQSTGLGLNNYGPVDFAEVMSAAAASASLHTSGNSAKPLHATLQEWNSKYNLAIMQEFDRMKAMLEEKFRNELFSKEELHKAQVSKLQEEIENLKELVYTYEKSLSRKDDIVLNLTRAVQNGKEKLEMAKVLTNWKVRMVDDKRESTTGKIALRHYKRVVTVRAWRAWRSTVQSHWRAKVEKACQHKSKEVCERLTDEYEAKLKLMNQTLECARCEIARLQSDRQKYEETMKKAFMRGVCALNLEAMSIFNKDGKSAQACASVDPQNAQGNAGLSAFAAATASKPAAENSGAEVPEPAAAASRHDAPWLDVPQPAAPESPPPCIPPRQCHRTSTGQQQQQQQTKKRQHAAARTRTVDFRAQGGPPQPSATRFPAAAGVKAVLVERHHPNSQTALTHQALSHVAKFPKTPVQEITSNTQYQSASRHATKSNLRGSGA